MNQNKVQRCRCSSKRSCLNLSGYRTYYWYWTTTPHVLFHMTRSAHLGWILLLVSPDLKHFVSPYSLLQVLFLKKLSNILQMWNSTQKWTFGSGYEHVRWSWCCYDIWWYHDIWCHQDTPVKCRPTSKPGGSRNLRCWDAKVWMEQKGSEGRKRQSSCCISQLIHPSLGRLKKGQSSKGSEPLLNHCGCSLAKRKALTKEQICGQQISPIPVWPT